MRYDSQVKEESLKYVEHKFIFNLTSKKIKIPVYENGSDEELLRTLREFADMVRDYNFLANNVFVSNAYEFFSTTVKGQAKETWNSVLSDPTVAPAGQRDVAAWNAQQAAFLIEMIGSEGYNNQLEYLRSTKKPREMKVRRWVRRVKTINTYLELLDPTRARLTDRQIVEYVIAPNIPHSWSKDFRLAKGHLATTTRDAVEILEEIELAEPKEKKISGDRKDRREQGQGKGKGRNSRNQRRNNPHIKNPCRKHDGKHSWEDCPDNPRSSNFRGKSKWNDGGNRQRGGRDRFDRNSHRSGKNKSERRDESNQISRRRKTKKSSRRVRFEDPSSSSSSSESESEESRAIRGILRKSDNQPKSKKTNVPSAEILFAVDGKVYRALADSGTSASLASKEVSRAGKKVGKSKSVSWSTQAGEFKTNKSFQLCGATLPQFTSNRTFNCVVHRFEKRDGDPYDVILGRDVMGQLGLDLCFGAGEFRWGDLRVSMVPRGHLKRENVEETQLLEELACEEMNLLESKYEKAEIATVIDNQTHLNSEQREKLSAVLREFEDLFQGKLGAWNGPKIDIELKQGVAPFHGRPYKIPHAIKDTVKTEVNRLVNIGVLSPNPRSEWAAPSFAIPKKDGRIRFVSDFRQLNKRAKRRPYPLPLIRELIESIGALTFATAIDLSMGYYHMHLTDRAKDYCTIVLPWGKYAYNSLPMGFSGSSDVFQEALGSMFTDLERVLVYIDDILVLGDETFEVHLELVSEVLTRLRDKGLQVNPLKSFWAQPEVEYLGFVIGQDGLRPQQKKIDAILAIKRPDNQRQLRRFVGMINYYKEMWRGRADTMQALTAMTGKGVKFQWTQEMDAAFAKIKAILAEDTMLAYPRYGERFHVHTDASDKQMGGVVSQKDRPIAFFSRKLNSAQRRYTTTDKELLAIVETLKQFKTMLKGQDVVVHTDHQNLTYESTEHTSDRVLRQRLLLEEYGVTLKYVKGESNVVADALSRLPYDNQHEGSGTEESFLQRRVFEDQDPFVLDFGSLAATQASDSDISKRVRIGEYKRQRFGEERLATKQGKIVVPVAQQKAVLEWYHEMLQHPGAQRMYHTIRQYFTWKKMKAQIEDLVAHCDVCQRCKKTGKKKYGKLPLKDDNSPEPFESVAVDLVGPWKVDVVQALGDDAGTRTTEQEFKALTIIDLGTCLTEIAPYVTKRADAIAEIFDRVWLCRYPRPSRCYHDNGTEFTGAEFQEMLASFGIKSKPTTVKNPQANAVLERTHLTLGDQLRTQQFTYDDWATQLEAACQTTSWALRSTVHSTTGYSAGQLAFGRDMLMQCRVTADWETIKRKRIESSRKTLDRENASRIAHDYSVGDRVLLVLSGDEVKRKLDTPTAGPFRVVAVSRNGTVKILRDGYEERVNIRRLRPYLEPDSENL